jgi:hypothetical protein
MKQILVVFISAVAFCLHVVAQDPKLPAANLGLSNMQDGRPPGEGFYFQQFVQTYAADISFDAASGPMTQRGRISSLLSVSQLIYISQQKFAGGNVGWTLLIPLVKISAYDNGGKPSRANPESLGDLVTGPFIQWFDRRIAGLNLNSRLELDVVLPSGGWQSQYVINPGAHSYAVSPHYTFTLSAKQWSLSTRQYLTYNFDQIGTDIKAGAFYNANYSLEYELLPRFRAEMAGYYLRQFAQDSKGGNVHFYQNEYGLSDTRERVFAIGPGLGYVTATGLFIEIKNMWEVTATNRTQGCRATLVLAYKLH